MRAGNQLAYAFAALVGEVSKGHTGSPVGEEGLVYVTLVGIIVADKSGHTVEAFSFVLAEVEDEGNQCRKNGAEVHVYKVFSKAKENLFSRIQACFVEAVSG